MSSKRPLSSILLIRLSALGDFVLTLPWIEAIRKQNPGAKITLLTTPPLKAFAEICPHIDTVWAVERWRLTQPLRWLSFARELRARGFERTYDLQRNDRTRIMSLFAPAALKKQWFGRKGGPDFAEMSDPPCPPIPAFEDMDRSWLQADTSRFNLPERYILMVPGCAPGHNYKRWPATHFAQVANTLDQDGIRTILIGTKAEKEEIDAIKQVCTTAVDLSGQTSLLEIAAIAKKALGAIGNDTGPMHLISLAGCPVVSLFSGRTNPHQSAPRGVKTKVLQAEPIHQIAIDDVLAAVRQNLSKPATT